MQVYHKISQRIVHVDIRNMEEVVVFNFLQLSIDDNIIIIILKNKILEYLYFTVVCDSFYYLSAIILYNDITNIIYGILWSYHINFAFICLQIKDTIVNEMYVASYSVAFCKKKIV